MVRILSNGGESVYTSLSETCHLNGYVYSTIDRVNGVLNERVKNCTLLRLNSTLHVGVI